MLNRVKKAKKSCCQQIDLSAFRANELSTFRLAGKARRAEPAVPFLFFFPLQPPSFPLFFFPFSFYFHQRHIRQVSWAHEIRIEFHQYSDASLPLPLCNCTCIHLLVFAGSFLQN